VFVPPGVVVGVAVGVPVGVDVPVGVGVVAGDGQATNRDATIKTTSRPIL